MSANRSFSRRGFLQRAAGASAALALPRGASASPDDAVESGDAPVRPRNVLIFMVDEHNADYLSHMGHRHALTPNLDALANNGVFFENALCAYPVCTASRGAMHTGMWPHTSGMHLNVNPDPCPDLSRGLHPDTTLLGTVFHEHGYRAYHHGKWHMGDVKRHACYNWNPNLGSFAKENLAPAITEYHRTHGKPEKMPEGAREMWGFPFYEIPVMRKFIEEHPGLPYAAGRLEIPENLTWTGFITDQTLDTLDRVGDRPFMLTWSDPGPHGPHTLTEPYYSRIDPAEIDYPANLTRPEVYKNDPSCRSYDYMGEEGVREYLRCYSGRIQRIDRHIGRVIERLKEKGEFEDTLIVFIADHGDMCGSHRTAGGKAIWSFYDEIVRVPFFMHWPRGIQAGRRVKTFVNGTDLMPTLLDYAGLPVPEQCQGISLRRFIEGEEDLDRRGFCEATHPTAAAVRRMIATHDFRLWLYYAGPLSQNTFTEFRPTCLYRTSEDPGEEHNLAEDPAYAGVRRNLTAELLDWMRETGDPWLERLPKLV